MYWRPSVAEQAGTPASLRLTSAADPDTPISFIPASERAGDWSLNLVQPLVAGTTYVLEDTAACEGSAARVTFTAGPAAPLPSTLGSVHIGAASRMDLDVATAAGSCSTPVDTIAASVQFLPTVGAGPWKDLFLYETLADGQAWFSQSSITDRVPPGESWRGRGRDMLYHACTPNPQASYPGLTEGSHRIAFRATLPGTNIDVTTPDAIVHLICDAPDEDGKDDIRHDGCASSMPSAAVALLLLALVTPRRRGRTARG
ncbi:MAG TPA: hypothetical protein VK427_04540 [Kofleriaceae bacterium]|nr:hypothetical protein [Kofleriaceae bacterium]